MTRPISTRPTAANDESRHAAIVVVAGGTVLALSFGVRSVFGGVIEPISTTLFDGRIEVFSLSIAIQNLVWGLAQPVFGIIADTFGDRRALWLGFVSYLAGMALSIVGTTALAQHLGAGVLVGMGISGTAFGIVLTVVGRAAPEDKRGAYLGIASAIGSAGQVVLPLLVSVLIAWLDWRLTLLVITFALAPMALCIPLLRAGPAERAPTKAEAIGPTLKAAFSYPSYLLLAAGFFVCGFHLAFITAHLPNYVRNFCISSASPSELEALGLRALALAGLTNIVGTLVAARLGMRFPKPGILAAIYAIRAAVILVFIWLPLTPLSLMIFALVMGGLWLSTVPLTSALVLTMFGPRAMGVLFGFIFLSHQLGGFAGVWLGGVFFDRYGGYDEVWSLAIALGILSSIAHLLVDERPAPRAALAHGG
ncbi:MFS transporter [Acuticoccus sp. M5D2P5]|uniref:MFS transporter n=1 Tax=Acuticoccus kalidii TaxID=2910977 RepID=UPI001F2CBD89|nr:MFS transporter [Acuticoccus kalidii]MCF3934703.1 MFS transporter [Acuticoccus kalidii]